MSGDCAVRRVQRAAAELAIAAAAALAAACAGRQPPGVPAAADPAISNAPPPTAIQAEGLVGTAPGATVTVGAEAAGRVVAVNAGEGDRVEPGAVLVALDDVVERAALEEARAQLAVNEAQLAFQERHYDRVDTLVRAGHVSIEELDVVTRDRAAARAQVQAAQAEVDRLAATLDKRTVRSPLSGRVVARSVEPGQMVAAGTPLLTIADLSLRRVEAEVDECDIAYLRIGEPAAITADGYEDQAWRGRVVSIAEQVVPSRLRPEDPTRPSDTRVVVVKIRVPAAAPFKLGQRVQLRIGTPSLQSARKGNTNAAEARRRLAVPR